MTIEEKAKRYDEAIEKAKYYYDEGKTLEYVNDIVSDIFPEFKESEDDNIRKNLKLLVENYMGTGKYFGIEVGKYIAWLEKQSEQKSNPYSGVSFEYNGHTWGMCARDGGVEIAYDKQLIASINPIREKNKFDNFSKVADDNPIGGYTEDFIMCTAPNHDI